jgi:hypothetical protein
MNPNTQNAKSASSANAPMIRVTLFMSVEWVEVARPFPPNACNHRAATSDCPFENARLRGSGALLCSARMSTNQPHCEIMPHLARADYSRAHIAEYENCQSNPQ